MSTCIGLWSPEAPQYSASVSRLIGGVVKAGSASPTLSWEVSTMADHRDAVKIGHMRAVLVGDAGLAHDELEQAAFLVVDVGDALLEAQRVAGIHHRVVVKSLLAVQDLGQRQVEQLAQRAGVG